MCPDPAHPLSYGLVHGQCVGCRIPTRGETSKGDLSRTGSVHGVVAEERRATHAHPGATD